MNYEIDMHSQTPIYAQLRNQIVRAIASKQLRAGEKLPPVRRLAESLGINFHTVNKAIALLCEEGFVVQDRRRCTVVAEHIPGEKEHMERMTAEIRLSAAEAICRGMDYMNFVAVCMQSFRDAMGESADS